MGLAPKRVYCNSDVGLSDSANRFVSYFPIEADLSGNTMIEISGMVRSSIEVLVKGEGSCSFVAERRFPKIPKTLVLCAIPFCIAMMIQMVAEVEVAGILTGALDMSASADFEISGSITLNPSGDASADFVSPRIVHKEGFSLAAAIGGFMRMGLGPQLVVWPMPGVPITVNPMLNAEFRGETTAAFAATGSGTIGLMETNSSTFTTAGSNVSRTGATHIAMCGAAALNIYADTDVQGFALPEPITFALGTRWIQDAMRDAILAGAAAMVQVALGPLGCIPGVSNAADLVMEGAMAAASFFSGLIPDLNLDFSTPSMELLAPTKLFCIEAVTTPNFATSSCATEVGCKGAGRMPNPTVQKIPPEQIVERVENTGSAPTCYDLPMGDRFIQLGDFRIAAIDDNHLSISHRHGQTEQIFRNDGTVHPGPRTDYNAWGRPIGPPSGVAFGFQFIEIGSFRLGSYDGAHFSISHKSGWTEQIFRSDGTLHPGPRQDYHTWDRPVSQSEGITFGDRFVQIGPFRLGDHDGVHLSVTHVDGYCIQIYRSDGTLHPGPRHDFSLRSRLPNAWTCKTIDEAAFGACTVFGDYGNFGDRFVQFGDWRLAAIDDTHLSFSHRGGYTSMVFRSDGTRHGGPRTDYGAWHRPNGFPYGITFGPGFIELGNFRIGDVDGQYFSISHSSGWTSQIFQSDGTMHPGPRTDFGLWTRSSGPARGVTFGPKFLQLGRWRLGDSDGHHMQLTQWQTGMTAQIYRSDGTDHPGPRTDWSRVLMDRYPQWHCGMIEDVFGLCTGLVAGDRFLQLGKWRLADIDGTHFSVSSQSGQTAQIYHSAGTVHPGPRTDFGSWGRSGAETSGDAKIAFGDRFIQFGHWRLAAIDDNHLSISHSGGKTAQIFHKHGTLHPGPRTDFGAWGRPSGPPVGVSFGDRFLQLGPFRVGDVDGGHFSVSHVGGKTAQIFRDDGTLHPGPRTDFTTFGRSLQECSVVK